MHEEYVVFTGRSNAGKSSIIKKIFGLDVATGKNPGTTKRIQKYPLSKGLFLVDMPGFGAITGASKRFKNRLSDQIINFLEENFRCIVLAIHVINISTFLEVTWRLAKKNIKSLDTEMVQFLQTLDIFTLVAANKIDKADEDTITLNLKALISQLNNRRRSEISSNVFPVSAKTGKGLELLKNKIHERLVKKGYKTPFKLC